MGLFKKAEPEEPLDPEFFVCLVPQDKRGLKLLGRAQPSIRRALQPGEKVTCIACTHGMGVTVVTNSRFFALNSVDGDLLYFSVFPNGLDVEAIVKPSIDQFEVRCSHPQIPFDVNGNRLAHWYFKNPDDVVTLAGAVKLLIENSEG